MARNKESRTTTVPEKAAKPISDMAPEDPGMAPRPDHGPTAEEIRARAYHRYEERGRTEGKADEDWYTAEQELRRTR